MAHDPNGIGLRGALLAGILLTVSLLMPLAGAQLGNTATAIEKGPDGELILLDGVGDVGILGFSPAENPAMEALYSQLDIERVVIGKEEADRMHFKVDMAPRQALPSTVTEAVSLQDLSCYVSWSYHEDMVMTLGWYETNLLSVPGEPPSSFQTYISYYYRGDEFGHGNWNDGIKATYDTESDAFDFVVRKDRIPTIPEIRPPMAGDSMSNIYARCRADVALFGSISDTVFGGDARFRFHDIGQGEVLNVRFEGDPDRSAARAQQTEDYDPEPGDSGTLTVAPGLQSVIPLRFENRADGQRIVVPKARILDDGGSAWNLTLPETMLMRSKEVRTVNLFVTPPADTPLGTELRLEVSGAFTGGPMEGHSVKTLVAEPQLDAGSNTFYFHSDAPADGGDPIFEPTYLTANLIQDDPRYTDGHLELLPALGYYFTGTLSPIGMPVILDPDGTVQGTLQFDADQAATLNVNFYLFEEELGTIAKWSGTMATGSPVPFEVPLLIDSDSDRLATGTVLSFRLEAQDGLFSRAEPSIGYRFVPAGSTFSLPATAVKQQTVVTDGVYVPNLKLAEDEDHFVYLNAGKQYAFELNLSNDGQRTDDLTIETELLGESMSDWDVEVLPGRSYRVQAGNGTPVAVVVTAPEDATEGEKLKINVTAVSKHDKVARSTVELTLVVTNNVPLEGKEFKEKEGQLEALSTTEESPSVGLSLVALLALAMLAGSRRHC